MGVNSLTELRLFGELLARLKEPEAPKGLKDMTGLGSMVRSLWHMRSPTAHREAETAKAHRG